VSIIMPAHNAAATISETIRSLAAEAPCIHELIVIDDSSTDGTGEVVLACAATLAFRVVLLSVDCRDAGSARNHGLAHATGRWIYFFDADDLHEEGGLRALVAAGEQADAAGLVVGSYYIRREGRSRALHSHRAERLSPEAYLADRAVVIVVGSALVRRDVLDTIRFPGPLPYDEDTLFWAALLAACRAIVVPRPVMTYNVSLQRSDERLVHESRHRFEQWRGSLLALESRGIRRHALRRREAFMAIRVARIHMRRGELADAGHFLSVARRAPKTGADAYRWLRLRLKLAWRRGSKRGNSR
jgi:glycosyltransferase involved in cell wall biosynthesis